MRMRQEETGTLLQARTPFGQVSQKLAQIVTEMLQTRDGERAQTCRTSNGYGIDEMEKCGRGDAKRTTQLRQSVGGMASDAARRDAGELTEHRCLVRSPGDGIGKRIKIMVYAHALLLKREGQFSEDDRIGIGGHAHSRRARRLFHDLRITSR